MLVVLQMRLRDSVGVGVGGGVGEGSLGAKVQVGRREEKLGMGWDGMG